MVSSEQRQILWNASDETLYPEAVALLQRLVNEKECMPLPASQVAGLLNIANASSYSELSHFIRHQRERNWPESKKDIKVFYTELEERLTTFKKKWLPERFPLNQSGKSAKEVNLESDELMALVAREFIQHLMAENMLLITALRAERAKRR